MTGAPERARVGATPAGVRLWLGQERRSAQRDLMEHLLGRPPDQALDLRSLGGRIGRPVPELARALFELNRNRCVSVGRHGEGPECAVRNLGGLSADLRALAGTASAVVADHEGLPLGHCGWSRSEADLAATLALRCSLPSDNAVRWRFLRGEVTVWATAALDADSPAWVGIGRRLLHACGPLAPESCA